MKVAQLQTFDVPEKAVFCTDVPDPPAPGPNQITADIEAFPLNPADLHQCEGTYAVRPDLPALIGAEAVGRVREVGANVTTLAAGDRIIFRNRENWVQRKTVDVSDTIRLPDAFQVHKGQANMDQVDIGRDLILQAAMLKVNPATALMMLRDYVQPEPGDYVIHNAANSAVGVHIVKMAERNGWRTLNVVRSDAAEKAVRAAGGDIVLRDTDELPDAVAEAADGRPVRLGIDSVGGESSRRLASSLSENATLVTFGRISGQPMQLDSRNLIFRGLTVRGFWLSGGLANRSACEIEALYRELAEDIAAGRLHTAIEATYPISEIKQALAHARRSNRSGKIVVVPQGG
ncbi:MAG TPA: zinc-dependent alcohol dehydrogenase family protein [Hyphomicrobiaceae bacterium]|nr:zinc-dependent alcohol dehydrogenase family protein [Hyphomicrobiaceae bacterium]